MGKMFNWRSEKNVEFTRVPGSEDAEELLSDSERSSIDSRRARSRSRCPSLIISIVVLVLVAVTSALLGIWAGQTIFMNPDRYSMRHISQYSPIVSDVGVKYSLVRFNGSLMLENVYRQDAGPEVDAAWKSLGADFRASRIPSDKASRSGLAPDQVKIQEKYGGGYPANVEGMHHLHCLNLLRKSLFWNFDYYKKQAQGPFSNNGNILKYHVTHCLDILRQQLMCAVDVGVLGQVWYQPDESVPRVEAFVDFNTMHKCRNFDDIRDWAERNQLPDLEHTPEDFLELPREGDTIYHEVP